MLIGTGNKINIPPLEWIKKHIGGKVALFNKSGLAILYYST
jgi:hypothetical protein